MWAGMENRADIVVFRGAGIWQEFFLRDDDGGGIDVSGSAGVLSVVVPAVLLEFGLGVTGDATGSFFVSGSVPLDADLGVFEVQVWASWVNGSLPSPDLLLRLFLTVDGRPE